MFAQNRGQQCATGFKLLGCEESDPSVYRLQSLLVFPNGKKLQGRSNPDEGCATMAVTSTKGHFFYEELVQIRLACQHWISVIFYL
ncbi:unnamed protein product [Pleuronectes platessa]|uniref:Uncharacterized protein n=1 Tax=Pleuronectes platessa TaxID=8262 RepID=A0A9N7TJM8_PLEPL|nr:unnamed protein product [Pleuronectes platessa]